MDKQTQHILAKITANLPRALSEHLMMDDPLDVQYDEMNKELMKTKHLDAAAKETIMRAAKSQKRAPVVNPVIARQIDEYYDREIKKAIAQGYLPKPDADRFLQDRARKLRELS